MSKHSILQKEVLSNNLPRNSFDLSFRHLFTADVGELLPIYCEHVNPNEHFSINPSVFLRAQTLNTAAFTRMKQNVDFFFIPYRLISQFIPQMLVSTDFVTSNLFPNSVEDMQSLPMFTAGASVNSADKSHNLYPVTAFDVAIDDNPLYDKDPSTQQLHELPDMFGFGKGTKAARLMELLGYGRLPSDWHIGNDANNDYGVSPLNIFAYNKVYQDFYRNPLLEKYNADLTSLDYCFLNPQFRSSSSDASFQCWSQKSGYLSTSFYAKLGLFDVKYHNYKMDYFTHQFTDYRIADFLNTSIGAPSFSLNIANDISTTKSSFSQGFLDVVDTSYLSISNLRSAYALDKLLAVTQNAKDGSYNSQIAAHFGFDPHLDSQKVQFIGSVDSPITISDVEGTATTEQSSLGQICGKGVSLTNGSFEFDTKEHGIILGIFYILPEADYTAERTINPFTLKTAVSDYFKPEFQDLGLQPCTMAEILGPTSVANEPYTTKIFGYTNRYSEYKSRVDLVSGEFNNDLNAWVTPRQYSGFESQVGMSLNLAFSKVNPRSVDNIFAITADGTHNQFLCAALFNVTAIRPMSIFGSPYSNI